MSQGLLDFPGRMHVDAWVVVLALAAAASVAIAVVWPWRLGHWWRHHPYRMTVEAHVIHAESATAALLTIAVIAHALGWEAWGAPLLGAIGLTLLLATFLTRRLAFMPQLRAYEEGSPELAVRRAKLRPARGDRMLFPLIVGAGGALVGYFAFTGHRWNHAFHQGMYILGFLVAFAVASLVATQLEDVARFQRDIARIRPAKRKARR